MRRNSLAVAVCAVLLTLTPNVPGQPASSPDVDKLEAMNQQILALYHQGQYTQALALASQALKLSEETLGPEHPMTANCLNDLGGMYQRLGDYTNAETMFERGLAIREKVLGPEHPYTARNLVNLGSVLTQMGKYTNAEPLLLRALAINQKVLGPEAPATATSLSHLGNLYSAMGDYARGESYNEQALAISQKLFGTDSPDTATALGNLAISYIHTGEYARAEPLLQQVLAIREKALGPEHPRVGQSLQALGTLYYSMGNYARSEFFYQRAQAVQEKNPGPESPDIAITLDGQGMLYTSMGDYDKALPLYLRALKIQEKVFGPDNPTLGNTLGKLAALYEKAGRLAEADLMDQRVLKIDEKSLGPEHPETAIAMLNLGMLYERMGDLSKAESSDKQALAIQEKALGPEHPDLSASLNNLASVYVKMGEYTRAEPLALRGLEIDDKVLGPGNPGRATHLSNLAILYFDLQETNEALKFADEAEQSRLFMLDNILSFTSEQERLNYQAQTDPYVLFASLNDAPRITLTILRHKGVVLDSLLEDRAVAEASQNPEDSALIEQLGPAKQQLTQLLMTVPKDLKPETLKSRGETRDALLSQVEQLEGALAQKVGGFGHARRALSVTVEDVQKAIPTQTALVEFIRYHHYLGRQKWEDRYGAAILTSSGEPKWVCLGSAADIEKNVFRCQQAVRDKQRKDESSLAAALRNLYKQAWNPIEAVLPADAKTIIISPDAGLNFVSFATLLAPDNKFLCEKHSIRYVTSGRDLLREPVQPSSQDMVIFAAPDYIAGGEINWPQTGVQLESLPYLATNAADLEAEVRPWNWPVKVYSGAAASETQLRAVHPPRILHFSTHGFFLPQIMDVPAPRPPWSPKTDPDELPQVVLRNPMYRSGIALAGAQVTLDAWKRGETPPTDSDGILTAEEVGDLDLHGTWLVVLAACDTGIGEPRSGEGVMGLRRGFVQAGAQNLMMTLWPVFDVPSGQLMLDFYSTLHQNNNPSEALAKVQRDWLVKLRAKDGLLPAVVMAGAFIVNSQGPIR